MNGNGLATLNRRRCQTFDGVRHSPDFCVSPDNSMCFFLDHSSQQFIFADLTANLAPYPCKIPPFKKIIGGKIWHGLHCVQRGTRTFILALLEEVQTNKIFLASIQAEIYAETLTITHEKYLGLKVMYQLSGADIQEPHKGRIFCIAYWQDSKKTFFHAIKIKVGSRGNIYTSVFGANLAVEGYWFQPVITRQSTIIFLSHPSYSIDCWLLKVKINFLLRWKFTTEKFPVVPSREARAANHGAWLDNYGSLTFSRPRLQDDYAIYYVFDAKTRVGHIWALAIGQNLLKTLAVDFRGHDLDGLGVQVQKLASDTLFLHGFCVKPSCKEAAHLHRIYLLPI